MVEQVEICDKVEIETLRCVKLYFFKKNIKISRFDVIIHIYIIRRIYFRSNEVDNDSSIRNEMIN